MPEGELVLQAALCGSDDLRSLAVCKFSFLRGDTDESPKPQQAFDCLFMSSEILRTWVFDQVFVLPRGEHIDTAAPVLDNLSEFAQEMRFDAAEIIGQG